MARETGSAEGLGPATGGGALRAYVALGGNLPLKEGGSPRDTLAAALEKLEGQGIRVLAVSRWYESAPVPVSDQPRYVNGVAAVETSLSARELMARLHEIEAAFGRRRSAVNAARTLDLDLIDYGGQVDRAAEDWPVLPHPRACERAFVLLPLSEVAGDWRDPVSGREIAALIAALPSGQDCRPMEEMGNSGRTP